jgi:hypothetical protein
LSADRRTGVIELWLSATSPTIDPLSPRQTVTLLGTAGRENNQGAHVPFGPSNFSGGVNLEIILAALVAQVSGLTRLVHPKLHFGFADFVGDISPLAPFAQQTIQNGFAI